MIFKISGETYGGTVTFRHKGTGGKFFVGFGMAPAQVVGHGTPVNHILSIVTLPDEGDWTSHSVDVLGYHFPHLPPGRYDTRKVIADYDTPNIITDYILMDWDDDVFAVA